MVEIVSFFLSNYLLSVFISFNNQLLVKNFRIFFYAF